MKCYDRLFPISKINGAIIEIMKTRYEFKQKALDFAKKDPFGYDTVWCWGLYKDYEAYSAGCKSWRYNPPVMGMPRFILASAKEVKWASGVPLDIMKGCKKIPPVVFEYDSVGWYANTFTVTLFADGTLQKAIHRYSKLEANGVYSEIDIDELEAKTDVAILANDKQLAKDVKEIVKKHHDILRKIDRNIYNPNIMDGAEETLRFGRLKFKGDNILTQRYDEWKKYADKNSDEQIILIMEDLGKIQTAFNEIKEKINSYSKDCL